MVEARNYKEESIEDVSKYSEMNKFNKINFTLALEDALDL